MHISKLSLVNYRNFRHATEKLRNATEKLRIHDKEC